MNNKVLGIALATSVLLNIGAVGFYIGQGCGKMAHRCKKLMTKGSRHEHRAIMTDLKEKFSSVKEANKEHYEELCMVKEELVAIIGAENFDEALYAEKVAEMREIKMGLMTTMADHVKNMAAGMPKEEREIFAHKIKHYMAVHHHKH